MKALKAIFYLSGDIHVLPTVVATDIRGFELMLPSKIVL